MAQTIKIIRSRNWAFTDFELLDIKDIFSKNKDIVRYVCRGIETCPVSGKKHHQGFIQFANPKRFNGVKKIFTNKTHIAAMRSTVLKNVTYCRKENNFLELGSYKTQGSRTDLEQLRREISSGTNMYDIASDHFHLFLRYNKGIAKYRELYLKEVTKEFRFVTTTVLKGGTGVGKTREATSCDDYFKIEGSSLQWWDGYQGESTLIIDEYNNDVKITRLLDLLDGYQLRLPIKGGFTYANWTKVVITTNLKHLHPQAKLEHLHALERRVTNIVDMGGWHEVSGNTNVQTHSEF